MNVSPDTVRRRLRDFDLAGLFVEELGWDRHSGQLPVTVEGRTYLLRGLAQKRGVQIFQCDADGDGRMPDHGTRRKIEKQVTKSAYEHLIIFVDGARAVQIWQWVAREPGQPAKYREYAYHPGHQAGESLVQKLHTIYFPLSEEEAIDLTGTVHRLRDAFDRDRVTKKFYERFKAEHGKFLKFISGISDTADREWYASLMLNRLMFVYFIQQKSFLDGDQRYLQNRLRMVQERKGKGRFYTFYRYFLLRLFHEGFTQQQAQRAPDLEELLGNIPYLDGGLFDVHQLEEKYPEMNIPDEAFEGLFTFFDQYEWHLDARPLRNDREINPDVLGYIFEKFVNQKQMGAYYTKEDITEYIGKNTIIPYLFDSAHKKCTIAFEPGSALWQLPANDPDRYIYEPVRRGVVNEKGEVIPESVLPEFVQKGMNDPKARMFEKKYNLGDADLRNEEGRKLTLPSETWREYANRRKRCLELREKLANGEIHEINDLITFNLNIRQFAEDAISTCEGPELLRAFYAAISSSTVLDPTCGSGAFLFAALNILEPLYEACLVRMEAFLEDLEHSGEKHRPEKFGDFRRVLAEIDKHPNRRYFILKSIIINNLYGVDIMEEAVEICKLRLFLKLVAQVDRVKDLEPLPDIDFNIRPGNTLVGFARLDDVKATLDGKFGFKKGEVDRITEDAEIVDRAYRRFHEMQTVHDMDAKDFAEAKRELRSRLAQLTEQLDRYLATEYGISESIILNKKEYQVAFHKWRIAHRPFHWFADFYGIMNRNGFDVIIGNPPYVEYSKVRTVYRILGYSTETAGNLYAFCAERSYRLLGNAGRFGFIVQAPIVSTQRMGEVRAVLRGNSDSLFFSTYDDRPSKLFDGMHHCRLAIILSRKGKPNVLWTHVATTRYHKWYKEERQNLFEVTDYITYPLELVPDFIPKFRSSVESGIFKKVTSVPRRMGLMMRPSSTEYAIYYKITGVGHWFTFTMNPPRFWRDGLVGHSTRESAVFFPSQSIRDTAYCLFCSTLHYWLYQIRTNCRDFNPSDLQYLPVPLAVMAGPRKFTTLAIKIMERLEETSEVGAGNYTVGGTVSYQRFKPGTAKPIFDEIDELLAEYYSFTDEELDFIINYDIKYRMGQDGGEDEDGERP